MYLGGLVLFCSTIVLVSKVLSLSGRSGFADHNSAFVHNMFTTC